MIEIITTANRNTDILTRLAFNANIKLFEAPKYLANFKILKTRSKRNARNATNACVPINTNDKYFGIVDNKSMIP